MNPHVLMFIMLLKAINVSVTGQNDISKVQADILVEVNGSLYHLELQTKHDGDMLLRVIEYQLEALINTIRTIGLAKDGEYWAEIELRSSAVVQLERSANVPDAYILNYVNKSTQQRISQEIPIVKMWEHSIDELVKKDLNPLLPLKLLNLRQDIEKSPKKLMDEKLVGEFMQTGRNVKEKILKLHSDGIIPEKTMKEWLTVHLNMAMHMSKKYMGDSPAQKDVENMIRELQPNEIPSPYENWMFDQGFIPKEKAETAIKEVEEQAFKNFAIFLVEEMGLRPEGLENAMLKYAKKHKPNP